MKASIQQTIKHWGYLLPFISVPRNESEYDKLLAFVDKLMVFSRQAKDERVTTLLTLVAKNIETYETHRFPSKSLSPIEMLEFLMEEHGLGQNDLPEIGGQSLVIAAREAAGVQLLTALSGLCSAYSLHV